MEKDKYFVYVIELTNKHTRVTQTTLSGEVKNTKQTAIRKPGNVDLFSWCFVSVPIKLIYSSITKKSNQV
ncbi:hypothetical protein JXQ31_20395 [candidate division KSB1 bacterium]|nr:hypothetical protein [candidate division KSB1 bacterium]